MGEKQQNSLNEEARGFDQFYVVQDKSATLKAIFRDATGLNNFPVEIVPYSFVSAGDLQRIASLLRVTEEQHFADIACGNGSLGLWLAKVTTASLTGVDVSGAAVELAREKSKALGLATVSQFSIGSFENTGLESDSMDAAVSIDALWLAADQQQALMEIARILRKGARFVFTSWEQHIPMPFVKQAVKDYRPLLEAAGFEVETYDYLPDSERLMNAVYEDIRSSQAQLLEEMGDAINGLIGEAHFVPGLVDGINYISRENGPHVLVAVVRT